MQKLARKDLLDKIADLETHSLQQQQHIVFLQTTVAKLEEERRLDRARRFGASADRGDHQYRLFDEAEAQADDGQECESFETITVAAHTKRRARRKPLPVDLPRVVIEHDLPESERHCECGAELKCIGTQTSEQLDVIPAQVFVIEHRRYTYTCRCCEGAPRTAPLPAQPIPKSLASPGLLAHVAVSKYADGLPLYRQSAMFKRLGIELPRQTLARHMIKAGALITPLVNLIADHLRGYDVLQMDETQVQVLKEPGKAATSHSFMWVMKGGPPRQPGVIYHYARSRSASVALELLGDYAGYLQTDAYAGYHAVVRTTPIIGLGCWAHVRRKFIDAQKALPKAQQSKGNRVQQALAFIAKLYQLEREIAEQAPQIKAERRQAEATAVLKRFKAWLDKQSIPPQSLLGKAIAYTLEQWPRLIVYLKDGRLAIDNNGVENAIRPFAVGRKNWLFSDTPAGATASANLYSLIESAKANALNEYTYLKHLFAELPKADSVAAIEALLPWNVDAAHLDRLLIKPQTSTT